MKGGRVGAPFPFFLTPSFEVLSMKTLFFAFFLLVLTVSAWAGPKVWTIPAPGNNPGAYVQSDAYLRELNMDLKNTWKGYQWADSSSSLGNTGMTLYKAGAPALTGDLAYVGALGIGRKVIGTASKAMPYIGLALSAYMLYEDIRAEVDKDAASKAAHPQLENALNSSGLTDYHHASVGTLVDAPDHAGYETVTSYGAPGNCFSAAQDPTYYYNRYQWGQGACPGNNGYRDPCDGPGGSHCGCGVCVSVNSPAPVPSQRTLADTRDLLAGISPAPYDAALDPKYMAELDALMSNGAPDAASGADPQVLTDVTKADTSIKDEIAKNDALLAATTSDEAAATSSATAAASAASAASSLADALADYNTKKAAADAAPGDAAKAAAADAAKAALLAAQAAKAAADAVAAQAAADQAKQAAESAQAAADSSAASTATGSLPTNTYPTDITPPDKKSIPSLLASWVASSPLATMVRSFTITTSSGVCSVAGPVVYGQQLSFDFCRYTDTFQFLGGILMVIVHGFAVLVVIRGW
jgi:hypothetical protein